MKLKFLDKKYVVVKLPKNFTLNKEILNLSFYNIVKTTDFKELKSHWSLMEEKGLIHKKRINRYKHRVNNLIKENLLKNFWSKDKINKLDRLTQKIDTDKKSPHELAKLLLLS